MNKRERQFNPPTVDLGAGTVLFHGTQGPEAPEFFDHAWFSDDVRVAQNFARYRGPDARVHEYRLTQDVQLLEVSSPQQFAALVAGLSGVDEYEIESMSSSELAETVCNAGYDGWVIPNNYPEGADILLCDAAEDVAVVKEVWRRNPLVNPLVEPFRSLVGPAVRDRLETLEGQWRHAEQQAQLAYGQRRMTDAQAWDERAEQLAEQLEGAAAAIEEEFDPREEREIHEEFEPPLPANYLAAQYGEWVKGRSPHFRSPAELVANLRAFLSEYDYPSFDESVSDAAILEAARDAYEAKQARRARRRARRDAPKSEQTFGELMRWTVVA